LSVFRANSRRPKWSIHGQVVVVETMEEAQAS
jgi:hypothetical protein